MRRFGLGASTWTAAIARGEINPRPRNYAEKPKGETRAAVERLLNEGRGGAEIAERPGVSKPTVCYHARKLGVPPLEIRSSARLGGNCAGLRSRPVDAPVQGALWIFLGGLAGREVKRGDIVPRDTRIPLDQLVVGRRTGRGHLKARLIEAGLKENQCKICGITRWMGKPVNMQLHHLNGDGSDNRLENIQFLCGTCHSQTDTYGGRNGHRKPDRRLMLVGSPEDDEDVA